MGTKTMFHCIKFYIWMHLLIPVVVKRTNVVLKYDKRVRGPWKAGNHCLSIRMLLLSNISQRTMYVVVCYIWQLCWWLLCATIPLCVLFIQIQSTTFRHCHHSAQSSLVSTRTLCLKFPPNFSASSSLFTTLGSVWPSVFTAVVQAR